jgi:hypothetical protein
MRNLYLQHLTWPQRLRWSLGYPYRRSVALWILLRQDHLTLRVAWRISRDWARR